MVAGDNILDRRESREGKSAREREREIIMTTQDMAVPGSSTLWKSWRVRRRENVRVARESESPLHGVAKDCRPRLKPRQRQCR